MTVRRPPRVLPWLLVAAALVLLPSLAAADDGTVFDEYRSRGMVWAYLGAFGFGVLTSLTPCVYPMIPIVVGIFGGRGTAVSRGRAMLLATLYVIGMGLMFAVLGVVFAMIGKRSGSLLGDPVVVIPIVLLYVILAASMFGAFELQLPSSVQQKLSSVSGDGAAGAFGMGLVGGFTAAPCTGPFLLGILGYVAQTKDVVVGSTLLFTYALGMGVLFWVLAAFSVALPKSGRWMEWMKSVGGIALVVAGIHFLKPIVPSIEHLVRTPTWFLAAAVAVAVVGLVLGAIHLSFHDGWPVRLRKGAAVALTVVGMTLTVNWIMAVDRHLPWIRGDEEAAFAKAKAEGKGVMIDFWASWCTPCKEFEHTFAASPVWEALNEHFVPLQFDVTSGSDADDALQARYNAGTPTVIFLTADRRELGRFHEYVKPGAFMKVLGPAVTEIKRLREATGPAPAANVAAGSGSGSASGSGSGSASASGSGSVSGSGSASASASASGSASANDEMAAFTRARTDGKGVMIDFTATWCGPCKELERTFTAPDVADALGARFVRLTYDVTRGTDADDAVQARYRAGTPTVIFVTADGKELGRLAQYVEPAAFLDVLRPAAAEIERARAPRAP